MVALMFESNDHQRGVCGSLESQSVDQTSFKLFWQYPPELWKGMEFYFRINDWRYRVADCIPTPSDTVDHPLSPPPTYTRVGSSRLRDKEPLKPYSRPTPPHIHCPQPLYHVPNLTFNPVPHLEEDVERECCRSPSAVLDRTGLDLPHVHHNPLIPDSPDDLEEEYCRLSSAARRITAEMQRAKYHIQHYNSVQLLPRIKNAEVKLQAIAGALKYCKTYAKDRGWTIDFDTIAHRQTYGMAKPVTSQVREMQCHSIFTQDSTQPTAGCLVYSAA